MANIKSSVKNIRKIETRTLRNRQIKSRLKTFSKKVDLASVAGNKEALASACRNYISALDKSAKIGIVHTNKVARQKSRCSKLLTT